MSIEREAISGVFKVDPGLSSFDTGNLSSGFSGASGSWLSRLSSALGGDSGIAGSIGSAIGGYFQNKADQKASKRQHAQNLAELELTSKNEREVRAAQAASDYFYNRMNRDRKRQGVASFRQFKNAGTIDQYKNPGV